MTGEIISGLASSLVTCIIFIVGIALKPKKANSSNGHVKWQDLTKHCEAREQAVDKAIQRIYDQIEEKFKQLSEKIDTILIRHETIMH